MKRKKKWWKRLCKISLFIIGLGFIFYFGLYFYAKYGTKLVIENANEFYFYDINGDLVEGLSDTWVSLDDISPFVIDATIAI